MVNNLLFILGLSLTNSLYVFRSGLKAFARVA